MLNRYPLVFFVLMICFVGCMADQQPNRSEIENLLKLSGADETIGGLPDLIFTQLSQFEDRFPEGRYSEVKELLNRSFSIQKSFDIYHDHFSSRLSKSELDSLVSWFQSETYLKVDSCTQTEEFDSLDFLAAERYGEKLITDSSLAYRSQQYDQFSESEGIIAGYGEAFSKGLISLLRAINPVVIESEKLSENDFIRSKTWIEQEYFPQLAQRVKNLMLYGCRNLSDKEIIDYLAFYTTPLGRKYSAISKDSDRKAHSEIILNFRKLIEQTYL